VAISAGFRTAAQNVRSRGFSPGGPEPEEEPMGRAQGWTYRLEPDGTDIDLAIVRVPSTLEGRVLDVRLGLGGGAFFARDLRRSVHLLQDRPDVPA
jgi:hypothetical protein